MKQKNTKIRHVINNPSWFRDTPHYWATASLPIAYAWACVEVVSKMSEKAGVIYKQIVEAWGKPGLTALRGLMISEGPNSEIEKVKNTLLHPESALLPDPNKPFRELEAILTDDDLSGEITIGDNRETEDFKNLHDLLVEFINIGFNRESDIAKGKFRVTPNGSSHWLILAIALRTYLDYQEITTKKLKQFYKVGKHKGKMKDFDRVLHEPMSRTHRDMVAAAKAVNLKLKNDRTITNAARAWYQCRIQYGSVSKYCDAQSKKEIILDTKNVEKQIRPCDDAVGYKGRLSRKPSN